MIYPVYGRLKHDWDRQEYDFKPRRIEGQPHPPESVPYNNAPRGGKFGWKLTPAWHEWLKAINWAGFWLRDKAYKGLLVGKAGWINEGAGVDSVSFGGNVVEIIGERKVSEQGQKNTYYMVRALAHDAPPSVSVTYKTHPQFVHKFTVVRRNGGLMKGGKGLLDQYIPLVRKANGEAWFRADRVELFPPLGEEILPKYDLKIHPVPNKDSYFTALLLKDDFTWVEEYLLSGGDVWGRIDAGWIMLQEQYKPAVVNFHTSWRMRTVPPL